MLRSRRARPGPRPDAAPGVAGDEVLEVGGDVVGARDGPVDVGVAEHRAAHLLAGGVPVGSVGGVAGSRAGLLHRGIGAGRRRARRPRRPRRPGRAARAPRRRGRRAGSARPARASASTSAKGRCSSWALLAAAVTRSLAAACPSRSRSPVVACSASSSPPVTSRVAATRSGSTTRWVSRVGEPRRAGPDGAQQLGQRAPLGVPRPGGALVLVQRGGGEQPRRRGPGAAIGGGPRGHRGDRVALVRQRRGPAAAGDVLAHLADLGLGQQHQVGGDGADRGAGAPEQARELGDPPALGVPGERGLVEVEAPGAARRAPPARGRRTRRGCRRRRRAGPRAARRRARRRRRPARAHHPAARSPTVIGAACWSSVRPAAGRSRCAGGEVGGRVGGACAGRPSIAPPARRGPPASPRCP